MNFKTLVLPTLISAISITGCQTSDIGNYINSTSDGMRQVNNVQWHKTGKVFEVPDDNELLSNQSRIILFQIGDDTGGKTEVNDVEDFEGSIIIGINGEFQVSLQSGQFSEVAVCSGPINISAELTGNSTNYLANSSLQTTVIPKHTYYYQVIYKTNNNQPIIKALDADEAINMLENSVNQTHQISRVVAENCVPYEAAARPAAPVKAPPKPEVKLNQPIRIDVLFGFDSAKIRSAAQPRLKAVAEFMIENPNTIVLLDSHTDSKGPASYNLKLSEARGNAVKGVLSNQYSINSSRIEVIAHGESKPIDTNDTQEGRQNNRRVEATIKAK